MKHQKLKNKFIGYMMFFIVILQFTYTMGDSFELHTTTKILISFLPIVPFTLALIAFTNMVKQGDEMFKKILSEAFILTGYITLVWTMNLGLLQRFDVIPYFSIYFVFFIIFITFIFSYGLIYKRYN